MNLYQFCLYACYAEAAIAPVAVILFLLKIQRKIDRKNRLLEQKKIASIKAAFSKIQK
ncbi:MAG: hypothetical protein ACI4NE_00600 [Succinivibrio sp.]